jgi:beta-lactamase class A
VNLPVLLVVVAVGASSAATQETPQDILRKNLERRVTEVVEQVDGVVGLSVKDLSTGETVDVNGDLIFTQASAIKIPVLFELFRQVEAGTHDLDELITLKKADLVPGSGVLQQLTPGSVTMTLRDYATLMVTESDNTATNMLIDLVGMKSVNDAMFRLGLTRTKLQRKMMDREAWLADRENLSTPSEQASLLELIYRGEKLSRESSDEILRILSIPKSSRIRPLLPPGTRVAHKTGSVPGVVVDVGIVYLEERPFIVAAMVNWTLDPEAAERAISELALLAYQYFDRLAHSNSFGHKE